MTSQQGSAASSQTGQGGTGDEKPAAGASQSASPPKTAASGGAIEALTADHRRVDALFKEFEKASSARKEKIVLQICQELVIHTLLEEEIFYPACREAADDEEPLDEAQVEHDSAKTLIADLMQGGRGDRFRDAKVKVLAEQIRHHVAEEEKPREGVFAKAKEAGIDSPDLAQRLQARKQELQKAPKDLPRPRPVSINSQSSTTQNRMEEYMPRQGGDYRERDDRGRFTSDDDDRGYRSRGGGRSRYDDEDDGDGRGWYGDSRGHAEAARRGWDERRGESRSFSRGRDDDDDYRSGGRYRERDERGRFASDDDDDDRGYRSRSRYDDDEDRGGRGRSSGGGRGQAGWFGDSEGHSEASRRGWEERGGGSRSRSRYDDDDDRGGRGGGRSGGERDDRGRFMSDDDDRGGSRSRSRYDDDDRGGRSRGGGRGQGGWFGDSEGHAEAARRGWEERGGGGGSRSRGRDDDDDDRGGRGRGGGGRGRGQGGWFGDSEGHAEAARRGWEDRR